MTHDIFGAKITEKFHFDGDILTIEHIETPIERLNGIIDNYFKQMDDARLNAIATYYECDLSEFREWLEQKNKKFRTNYDRIKAMSAEEMAVFMAANQGVTPFDGSGNLFERWLDWLKQEVKDGNA